MSHCVCVGTANDAADAAAAAVVVMFIWCGFRNALSHLAEWNQDLWENLDSLKHCIKSLR